ncbi:MAG: 50S ribosomal protein L32 [bacterium]|nr:50S ribosomal protein L32 [bacterium]
MRHTRAHTANRRSHHGLKGSRFVACKDCGAQHLMHRVCLQCGKYRGRLVVDVLKKTVKAAKKAEARKDAKKEAAKAEAKEKKETKKK